MTGAVSEKNIVVDSIASAEITDAEIQALIAFARSSCRNCERNRTREYLRGIARQKRQRRSWDGRIKDLVGLYSRYSTS